MKSAGRKAAVGLLGVFVALALCGYTLYAARAGAEPRITLSAAPSTLKVTAGAVARFRIRIRRTHFRGSAALWIGRGLPPGGYATFVPGKTRRASSMLIVTTTVRSRPGRYRLWLRATSSAGASMLSVTLIIAGRRGTGRVGPVRIAPFTIAGNAGSLQPGTSRALNLSIANPNRLRLSVTSLTVRLQSVRAPRATASLPCSLADFSVHQFSGSYPLIVAPSRTRSLSELGIPTTRWPQVAIIDRPLDQDGCQGASLNLVYRGTATLR